MSNQRGKSNISALLIMILIFYGGFVAFKFISARITKGQIKNDVMNRFGFVRGPDFSELQGRNIIRQILAQHGIIPDAKPEDEDDIVYEDETDIGVENAGTQSQSTGRAVGSGETKNEEQKALIIRVKLDDQKRYIKFQIRYEVVIDLILFKSKQVFDIQEQMRNFT